LAKNRTNFLVKKKIFIRKCNIGTYFYNFFMENFQRHRRGLKLSRKNIQLFFSFCDHLLLSWILILIRIHNTGDESPYEWVTYMDSLFLYWVIREVFSSEVESYASMMFCYIYYSLIFCRCILRGDGRLQKHL
jgi:hypothetical protein